MSIIANISKTASSVAKFMARYADEANSIADVFRSILPALPVNRGDREKIESVINGLDTAAERIAAFLDANPDVGAPVKVKASDIAKAVEAYLAANPVVIEAAVTAAIANTVTTGSIEGNGNA